MGFKKDSVHLRPSFQTKDILSPKKSARRSAPTLSLRSSVKEKTHPRESWMSSEVMDSQIKCLALNLSEDKLHF